MSILIWILVFTTSVYFAYNIVRVYLIKTEDISIYKSWIIYISSIVIYICILIIVCFLLSLKYYHIPLQEIKDIFLPKHRFVLFIYLVPACLIGIMIGDIIIRKNIVSEKDVVLRNFRVYSVVILTLFLLLMFCFLKNSEYNE